MINDFLLDGVFTCVLNLKQFCSFFGTLHIPAKVMNSCFVHCVKRISRNDCQILVSGNPLCSIPETTVNYF